eukprot:gb/GECG01013566.1/.p1 GENE.gb/GECG01013566.1/~~gb/GECG01013566.1/.p1  ORF type:complete len:424 (+),score=45.57 gb/GECG01013566.1/:1-1272(+)
MASTQDSEAHIDLRSNVLCFDRTSASDLRAFPNFQELEETFCGQIMILDGKTISSLAKGNMYLCGDIGKLPLPDEVQSVGVNILIVREFSWNYARAMDTEIVQVVGTGQVPVLVHHVGVLLPQLFETDTSLYDQIKSEHTFQTLTESNKKSNAFRKGIYLSPVSPDDANTKLNFQLLRCSSNLQGPTENFRPTDSWIVERVNAVCRSVFSNAAELNHVLAQEYINPEPNKKATIKAHSDKTEDMPSNALIAFATFYDSYQGGQLSKEGVHRSLSDPFDWYYAKCSVLTRLHFRLKDPETFPHLTRQFSVQLYPNSVFLIPLSTNRLYRHEIRPSSLDSEKIPVRIGYVIRSSCRPAYYTYDEEQTYISKQSDGGHDIPLRAPTEEEMNTLREYYRKENVDTNPVAYPPFDWSFNFGDFMKPVK